MSNLNPDNCIRQLQVAKNAIRSNEALITAMKVETAQKLADYNTALDNYNTKVNDTIKYIYNFTNIQ